MKRIFKYKLPRDGEIITINANVIKWLNIQEQDGWPTIWAVVDDAGYESEYEIIAWGTGWDFPDELNRCRYMGTAQDEAGCVWHYFMQEKAKSWSTAETAIAIDKLDKDYWYWNSPSIATSDYTMKITCGDADSAINSLVCNSKTDSVTAYLDSLMGALDATRIATTTSALT